MIKILLAMLTSFIISVIIMPIVIKLAKRLSLRQTVLSYVDNHTLKSGTPTMGGIAIILSVIMPTLVFSNEQRSLTIVALFVTIGYALVGFTDDFIKVRFRQNKGLTALQKIIFQTLIAIIVAVYAYRRYDVGAIVLAPFTLTELSLGVFAIPFFAIIFLAMTNAVNLTDGLDGLASRVTSAFTLSLSVVLIIAFSQNGQVEGENASLITFTSSIIGALSGFNCYNCYPAKIFMGDTGSLALGGAIACVAVLSRLSLYVPIIGIIYVLVALSVIIQVAYFKATKKRIFLMAPLHHHYERKGVHENRIVTVFTAITALSGLTCIILTLVFS